MLTFLVIYVQVYDTVLREFLDWEESTTLEAGSKIRAVQLEEPPMQHPPVTAEAV